MSIRRIQTERALQTIVKDLYSSGKKPTINEVLSRLQQHFDEHPAGQPRDIPQIASANTRSNPDDYNEMLEAVRYNLDVLYEVLLDNVRDSIELNNTLHAELKSLDKKRRRLERRVDDYLLGLRNTDGYFYSVSDDFADLSLVDTTLTSAQVDTDAGAARIPNNTDTKISVPMDFYGSPMIHIQAQEEDNVSYNEIAPLFGAVDDRHDNTVWAFEVTVSQPQEVIAFVDIPLQDTNGDPVIVSSIEFTPYGMEQVQLTPFYTSSPIEIQVVPPPVNGTMFGDEIKTGTGKLLFDDDARTIHSLKLRLRKTDYDYTETRNNQTQYRYVFGAERLTLISQNYERTSTFVSVPHRIPEDLRGSKVIDSISLTVDDYQNAFTDINYYVAAETGVTPSDVSQLDWKSITPLDTSGPGKQIVRFGNLDDRIIQIVEDADNGQREFTPLSDSGPVAQRNPSPAIIEGSDIYRITEFEGGFIESTLNLVEGFNSTRIFSVEQDSQAVESLGFWKDVFDNNSANRNFGKIDVGEGFFYGGDVGVGGRSIYVETYLHSPTDQDTILAEMKKRDDRSRTWEVRAFLNGNEVIHLPVGTDRREVSWNFNQGRNHVILLINIPDEDTAPQAYTGVLELMGGHKLFNFGDVFLTRWQFTDFFNMKYNESSTNPPRTFTVHNGELISRRLPNTRMQLSYKASRGGQPSGVVLRADMSRKRNKASVTPKLNSYRLRFSYGQG